MSTRPAIVADGIGKRFTKYDDTPMLVSSLLRLHSSTKRSKLWALRNVNFTVERGECVGIVGRNGSGKSTLLTMLAGVTSPTEGRVTVDGRVAPLISVGVGFHPELTGRENVYVNATILGLAKEEVDERFDEIVTFAEVEKFIDTPVKFYSSGMFVRLGFSVSVLAEPDVFLIDEVLAVGDLAFQTKCFDRIEQLRRRGTTIMICTHNLNAVRRLCDRTLVVHNGALRFDGDSSEALSLYHELLGERTGGQPHDEAGFAVYLDEPELFDSSGQPSRHFEGDDKITFKTTLRFERPIGDATLGIVITTAGGVNAYGERWQVGDPSSIRAGDKRPIEIDFDAALGTGSYTVHVGLVGRQNEVLTPPLAPLLFYVSGRQNVRGVTDLRGRLAGIDQAVPASQPATDPPAPAPVTPPAS